MKVDVEHEPGELAEKLPDVVARLVRLAEGDADASGRPLVKSLRPELAPHEHADTGETAFRFNVTRDLYRQAQRQTLGVGGRLREVLRARLMGGG